MAKLPKLIANIPNRYTVIKSDGGYILYDKETQGVRAAIKFIGKFYISTDRNKYVFNDEYYADFDALIYAMNEYYFSRNSKGEIVMEQSEKQLLLKDLCARLPCGVKYNFGGNDGCDYTMDRISPIAVDDAFPLEEVKPYLRPMSSMTEEEENEYRAINCYEGLFPRNGDALDYVLSNHFDYRGLIEKGLALEAPRGMYKTE